jgi:hypothetical protein
MEYRLYDPVILPSGLRPLKILHCALVLLGLSARLESAEIATPSSFRIDSP